MGMAIDPSMSDADRYAQAAEGDERRNVRVKAREPGRFGDEADSRSAAPEHPERRISRMVAVARLLDSAFVIPGLGVRVGWDSIVGLATGVGDVAGAIASLYIVNEARRLGAPRKVLLLMLGNIAIDTVVGAIPALGDIIDAAFKSNERNLKLIGVTIDKDGHTWDRPEWVRSGE